jgi:hypothetical protein
LSWYWLFGQFYFYLRVKKAERGIRILAPVIGIRRKKNKETEKDIRRVTPISKDHL